MARSSNRIKGITIEINGDTSGLNKALSKVDNALSNTQTKLKDINKLLKLNPGNTELLKQKQVELKQAISETSDRLKVLKDEYEKLNMKNGPGAMTEEQKALAREIIDTESKLKSLKAEMKDFGNVASQKLKAAGDALKTFGDKISEVGKDLSMKLSAPLLAVGTIGVNYNAQIEQYQTMFTTLTGSAEEADRIISQLQADAQKSPFDTSSLVEANQYLISAGVGADDARKTIQDLGNAIAATGGGSDELSRMAQNLQQIKNLGKASSVDIKQFANAGINIYGLLADSMGVSVEKAKEMDVTYDQLTKALAKASEEGGKYYGAMEAQGETLNGSLSATKESIQQLLGQITKSAMPVITKVLAKVRDVIKWFTNLDQGTKDLILQVGAFIAAIGPGLVIGGKVISVLGTVVSAIGAVVGVLGGPLTIVIAAAIAIGVSLIKNWQSVGKTFKDLANKVVADAIDLKNRFTNHISAMFQPVKDTFTKAADFIKTQIDKIKNFFNFKWEWPKLELPHFFNSGNTGPFGLPKIEVEWYSKAMKNGMILDSPTIFGASNGRLLGGGESGSELIIGTNSLMRMIQEASGGMTVNMTVNGGNVSANELADIVVDKLTTTIKRGNQRW